MGKAALAVGAITAASVLLVNEVGSVLEVVGIFGAINLASRNLFFAEDREKLSDNFKCVTLTTLYPTKGACHHICRLLVVSPDRH